MKCRACGKKIVVFSDGWVPHVLDPPMYSRTDYHVCIAEGENAMMLPKSICKEFGIEPEECEGKR